MSLIGLMIMATVVLLSTGRRAEAVAASVRVVVVAFVVTLHQIFKGMLSSEFCFLDKFEVAQVRFRETWAVLAMRAHFPQRKGLFCLGRAVRTVC